MIKPHKKVSIRRAVAMAFETREVAREDSQVEQLHSEKMKTTTSDIFDASTRLEGTEALQTEVTEGERQNSKELDQCNKTHKNHE